MSTDPHDIRDDEIRIISGDTPEGSPSGTRLKWLRPVLVALALICAGFIVWLIIKGNAPEECYLEEVPNVAASPITGTEENLSALTPDTAEPAGYVVSADTIISGTPLTIFRPESLTPTLHVGTDILDDSTVRFLVQAADIRADNGGIVGAFVDRGTLLSKGQAKSGFCAIIGGKITVGVADATPLLEQALETDGYFFRQYPLVVANQIVENRPRGKSLRKALAELDGVPVVIISREELTFHDFSQRLVDLGVSNAIYLVGGSGYGFGYDADGRKMEFGNRYGQMAENTNFLIWR